MMLPAWALLFWLCDDPSGECRPVNGGVFATEHLCRVAAEQAWQLPTATDVHCRRERPDG